VCKKIEVFGVPDTMKVGELSEEMAKRKIVCTPVANEAGEMYGFVDMMDLCTCAPPALKTLMGCWRQSASCHCSSRPAASSQRPVALK